MLWRYDNRCNYEPPPLLFTCSFSISQMLSFIIFSAPLPNVNLFALIQLVIPRSPSQALLTGVEGVNRCGYMRYSSLI